MKILKTKNTLGILVDTSDKVFIEYFKQNFYTYVSKLLCLLSSTSISFKSMERKTIFTKLHYDFISLGCSRKESGKS